MAFSTQSEHDDVMADINITPLVDVMLVLLVAFIVTAPLLDRAVPVTLPRTEARANAPDHPVAVSVDREGRVYLDQQPIAPADLNRTLEALHAHRPDAEVSLRGDAGAPYGKVATVLAALQRAGIARLAVVTQPG